MSKESTQHLRIRNVLDRNIRSRLHQPSVESLYVDFVKTGVLDESTSIIELFDPQLQEPIIHTLSTHVTKEKPQMVYHIGKLIGKSDKECRVMSASMDLLWSFSLVYDDIFDKDSFRAGVPTAWKKFGEKEAMSAIENGYSTVLQIIGATFGIEAAQLSKRYVEEGVESLREHKALTFSSTLEDIEANYIKRAKFHTDLALDIFAPENQEAQRLKLALRQVNMAGQILNDAKDLMPSGVSGRQNFSDIRGGFVTLPLKYIWERSDENEKRYLEKLMRQSDLSSDQVTFLQSILRKYSVSQDIKHIVEELYLSSDRIFASIIRDPLALTLFRDWNIYKLQQLENLDTFL